MAFGSFFKNLFGGDAPSDTPAGAAASPPVETVPAKPPAATVHNTMDRALANSILLREEILDARNRLCGYRFSLRLADEQPEVATEPLFLEALRSVDIPAFAQRRIAVIPLGADAIARGRHRFLAAPHTVFLIDLRQSTMTYGDLLKCLQGIRDAGSRAALSGVALSADTIPLLEATDVVFLDLAEYSLPHFHSLARSLRTKFPALTLAAQGVQSWAERRMCAAWGFEYCLGGFLATRDADEKEGVIDQGRLAVIEMLNLLRGEAELSELGAMAKKDPGIAFQLLALANSAAAGLASPVASLEQAILVLGRERLYRWLTVSMFRIGEVRDRDEALLEVALTRARFLETVAQGKQPKETCDELFLVGLLSLFDILLAMPMPKILSRMHLTEPLADVLLRSTGPYAQYLLLALALEKGRATQAEQLAAALDIAAETLQSTSQKAFTWAQEALGDNAAE